MLNLESWFEDVKKDYSENERELEKDVEKLKEYEKSMRNVVGELMRMLESR